MTAPADPSETALYRGFSISPMHFSDRGYLIDGEMIRHGFVISRDRVSIMPGAAWARTRVQAEWMIDLFIETAGRPVNEPGGFWAEHALRKDSRDADPVYAERERGEQERFQMLQCRERIVWPTSDGIRQGYFCNAVPGFSRHHTFCSRDVSIEVDGLVADRQPGGERHFALQGLDLGTNNADRARSLLGKIAAMVNERYDALFETAPAERA